MRLSRGEKASLEASVLDISLKPRVRQDDTSSIIDQDKHCEREKDNDDRQTFCGGDKAISILSKHISKPLTSTDRDGNRQCSTDCQNKGSDY
jgi:hypothetical protein